MNLLKCRKFLRFNNIILEKCIEFLSFSFSLCRYKGKCIEREFNKSRRHKRTVYAKIFEKPNGVFESPAIFSFPLLRAQTLSLVDAGTTATDAK